jgi:hypothetical protein
MSEDASPTSQMIRIPEALLADSYLLGNSRLKQANGYSDLVQCRADAKLVGSKRE